MRYEDWTFRETKACLAEYRELRRAWKLKAVPDHTTLYRFMRRLNDELLQAALSQAVDRVLPQVRRTRPLAEHANQVVPIRTVLADAEFDSERNHHYVPTQLHAQRHGHAVYALQHAKTMADYKAISMNQIQEDIRVTDGIYALLAGHEVQDRIANLTNSFKTVSPVSSELVTFLSGLSKEQLSEALIAIAQQLAN